VQIRHRALPPGSPDHHLTVAGRKVGWALRLQITCLPGRSPSLNETASEHGYFTYEHGYSTYIDIAYRNRPSDKESRYYVANATPPSEVAYVVTARADEAMAVIGGVDLRIA